MFHKKYSVWNDTSTMSILQVFFYGNGQSFFSLWYKLQLEADPRNAKTPEVWEYCLCIFLFEHPQKTTS